MSLSQAADINACLKFLRTLMLLLSAKAGLSTSKKDVDDAEKEKQQLEEQKRATNSQFLRHVG